MTTIITATLPNSTIKQFVRTDDPVELYEEMECMVQSGHVVAYSMLTLKSHIMADEV